MTRRRSGLVFAGVMLAAWPAAAQPRVTLPVETPGVVDVRTVDPHSFRAIAVRVPEGMTPRIDGNLDDALWETAPVAGGFIQREPDVGAPTTERTEFRVAYDDRSLFVAIWAFETDPDGIVASEMLRDSGLRKGDAVRLIFDTYHDHRNGFYFSTNPLGAQKDGYTTENGRMNWDWNAVWSVKTSRDDKGWYAEFEIPLSQIKFRDLPGEQEWGFNVGRIIIRKREETHFVPYPREWQGPGIFRVSGSGLLGGLSDLKPRRRLEVIPFLAPQASRNFDSGTPTNLKRGYGADLRASVTETLNADLTFHTDFAQVEADQEVVNLTRFNIFFPEKRQFFTEAAGTFGYGRSGDEGGTGSNTQANPGLLSLFYSRSIGLSSDGHEIPLIGGGRIAGIVGPYTVGFMNVETDQLDYTLGAQALHVPRANYTVARLKRNVLSSSTIGAIVLNRAGTVGPNEYNRTVGFDGIFTPSSSVKLTTLFAKTFTPGTSGRDMAGAVDFSWTTDRFGAGATYTDIQEAFNAEMGFIPRRDIRHLVADASWTPRPKWRGVRQLTLGVNTDNYEDHRGTPQTRRQGASFLLTNNDRSSVRLEVAGNYDLLPAPFRVGPNTIAPGGYSWDTLAATYTSDDSRRIYGGGGVELGGYYNGDKTTYRGNLNFLPRETLLVENSYVRNNVALPGASTYVTNVLSTRVSYSLSPTLFVKAFVQYNDDRRLAALNLLLWSIYRPGSDFYVVYNEGWETAVPGLRSVRVRSRVFSVKLTSWLSR